MDSQLQTGGYHTWLPYSASARFFNLAAILSESISSNVVLIIVRDMMYY
mgnify:CR=1 FL=1